MKQNRTNSSVEQLVRQNDWRSIFGLIEAGKLKCDAKLPTSIHGEWFRLLHAAIRNGQNDAALRLVRSGAGVNERDNGQTPLMLACGYCNHEVIKALLSAGADINLSAAQTGEDDGQTALMLAAERHDLGTVKQLLHAGADTKIITPSKQTAVYFATRPKASETTRKILDELILAGCPLLGNELHAPVHKRDVEITEALLEHRCPTNTLFNLKEPDGPKKGETPLTTAVGMSAIDFLETLGLKQERTVEKRQQIIRMLLAAAANPNLANTKGLTPLLLAVREQEFEIAKLLLKAGADSNYTPRNPKVESPVTFAKKKKLSTFMKLFSRNHKRA